MSTSPTKRPKITHNNTITIKDESIDNNANTIDLEQLIVRYMSQHSTSLITQHILMNEFIPYNITNELLLQIINKLLQQSRISLYTKQNDNTVYYRYIESELADRLNGLDANERMVYTLIRNEGVKGMWSRDIKHKTKLNQITLTKILKHLCSKKLIKSENTIDGTHKKIYILYELNINKDVRGSSWFVNGEFDVEYIKLIEKSIYLVLNKHPTQYMAVDEINSEIELLGIFTTTPELNDLETLCNALCIDGTLICSENEIDVAKYKLCKVLESSLTWIPCNACVVQHKCTMDGLISPKTCQYYKKWLEF